MLGIGIRIDELAALTDEVARTASRTRACGRRLRSVMAAVALPLSPAAVLTEVADELDPLSVRLQRLLDVMLDITWHGPRTADDVALVDPRDLPISWAMDVIEQRFARLDTAAKGNRGDGHVSSADLLAAFGSGGSSGSSAGGDPLLDAAIARIALDPLAWRVLDTGGDPHSTPDATFSRKDLRKVRAHGVDGIDLADFLHAAEAVGRQRSHLDTAAHGGSLDDRFSVKDLRAALESDILDPRTRADLALLLDHPELLPLLDGFAPHKGALPVRLVKGLAAPAKRVLQFSSPAGIVISLIADPIDTLRFPVRLVRGGFEAATGTAVGIVRLGLELERMQLLNPFDDPAKTLHRYAKLVSTAVFIVRHLPTVVETITDLDTLERDPDRWLGRIGFTLLSGGAIGGAAAELGIEQSLLVQIVNSNAVNAGTIVLSVEDRMNDERRRRDALARIAAVEAAVADRVTIPSRSQRPEPKRAQRPGPALPEKAGTKHE